jgi:hypothetical protein
VQKEIMKRNIIHIAFAAATLLLGPSLAFAIDTHAVAPQAAASKAKASTQSVKNEASAKPKVAAKVKLVDINSANSAELQKLPGITEAEAAKIVAGRPYGSKAWLVSNNILANEKYGAIRQLIVAKQPFKDGAKNAALYKKK